MIGTNEARNSGKRPGTMNAIRTDIINVTNDLGAGLSGRHG